MKNIKKSKKRRNEQKKRKNEKIKSKTKDEKTGEKKKEKRAQRGTPRWAQTLIFHMRTVKRNRNEIKAPKKEIRF